MIEFRYPETSDRGIIQQWIASDPEHSAKGMTSDFFFREDCMPLVLGDQRGPGLYVRVDPEPPESVRLHIQFSPDQVRSAKTLLRGWPMFSEGVWNSGIKRMVFDSISVLLIAFCKRAFGFKRIANTDDYELLREVN